MTNRTKSKRESNRSHQREKPHPEFRLTAHAAGRWCKKRRGTRFKCGKVVDG